MTLKQNPALSCSSGSGGGPAACGLSLWSPHPPERLMHELLRQKSPVGEYSPHQLGLPGQPGSLSHRRGWSAAAQTEVSWQCSLTPLWFGPALHFRTEVRLSSGHCWDEDKAPSPALSQWELRWGGNQTMNYSPIAIGFSTA